jgi:uncharacterized membrane protein YkoI
MRGSDAAADNGGMNHTQTPHIVRRTWQRQGLRVVIATALVAGVVLPAAWAGDDHDRARAAVQAGEVLPLPALLEQLQRTHPGQVLELELEQEGKRWIYEIKLLQPDGRLLKLDVDARTAEVLKVKSKEARKAEAQKAAPR